MLPVLTPEEMRAVDADAPEPIEVLIARAGHAVARHAIDLLGGTYGRRVVVLAGKGSNGADGRVAAEVLHRRGVRCEVLDSAALPPALPTADLVIDAAYGTGFRGSWDAPAVDGVPVLAVDVPSGLDALTGEATGQVLPAVRTVTFGALKPGLLQGWGPELAGAVALVDIGLDVSRATAHLVRPTDVAAWLPSRPRDTHKWKAAVWVVAGSPGMTGAAVLAARGAQRAGAGYVRLSSPGGAPPGAPSEVVLGVPLAATGWGPIVVDELGRYGSVVVGPGIGPGHTIDVAFVVRRAAVPVVVDADGLTALGRDIGASTQPSTVLTPHDGEYERLVGERPGPDRFAAARRLAVQAGCVVLLKGSTTVVAEPGGRVLVSTTGDARLATAGTGDVLAGIVGALLAQGVAPFAAAAAGAHLHGLAARAGWTRGLVAGDLPDLLPAVLESLEQTL